MAGADFLPFVGELIKRSATALIFVAVGTAFRFFWRKLRYPRRVVCRLVSRGGIGRVNGRPVKVSLEDQQGVTYEVHRDPGVMLIELHNLRRDDVLRDHIIGNKLTITFGGAEVKAVYKHPETDPAEIARAGNVLTLRPQYLESGKPLSIQVVLEGYSDYLVPKVEGEILRGGPIRLVRLDRPDEAAKFGRAFTFVFLTFVAVLLVIFFMAVQLTYPRTVGVQAVVALAMALCLTAIPYWVYYEWLVERGAPGRDFPPATLKGWIARHIPSVKFIRNDGFFWRMLAASYLLALAPLIGEMVISPLLSQAVAGIRWVFRIALAGG